MAQLWGYNYPENPTFLGSTTGSGTTSTLTVTLPTTVNAGDLLLLCGANCNSTPSGWTDFANNQKAGIYITIYSKTAVSSDSGSSFSVNFSSNGSGGSWIALDISGSIGPASAGSATSYGSSMGVGGYGLTSAHEAVMILAWATASGGFTFPSGFTQIASVAAAQSLAIGYVYGSTSGGTLDTPYGNDMYFIFEV